MKAQRRHELKTNTLAEALAKMPNSGRRFGTQVIISILVGILIAVLIRYRIAASQDRLARAADNLAVARQEIAEWKMIPTAGQAALGSEYYRDLAGRIDSVISDVGDKDPKTAALAMLTRGELNWTFAGVSQASTQPAEPGESDDELLKNAGDAYRQTIDAYPNEHFVVISARFGLGAVDESQHKWDDAANEYQAIIDDPNAAGPFADRAKERLAALSSLKKPLLIGQATTLPSFGATTQPE
jgi:hypothetical protein